MNPELRRESDTVLLTLEEVGRVLRLDENGDREPGEIIRSVRYQIDTKGLRPCRIGRALRVSRREVYDFIDRQTAAHAERRENTEKC